MAKAETKKDWNDQKDFQLITNEYAKRVIERMREELNDEEERERIPESVLSIEVRGDWHTPGDTWNGKPTEFKILLGTGGPASQIIGELDEDGAYPTKALFQYQDWFKPWTDAQLSDEEETTLLEYAQQFYFGE